MRYAFYVSGQATRVQQIIMDKRFETSSSHLSFVISDNLNKSEAIIDLCKRTEIDWIYYDYAKKNTELTREDRNELLSDFILEKLIAHEIDYLFVIGHHLLKGRILEIYKNRIIAFHAALLPHHRGFNGIDQAMSNGDFVIGNSAFFIDEGMDTGKVIMQSVAHRSIMEDYGYEAVLHPIVNMFYQIIKAIEDDRLEIGDSVIIKNAKYDTVHYYPDMSE